ncbi:glycosyltransferase [Fibrobacter sp.]
MKKKILIFLQSGVGGAERISVLIGKNLNPDVFDVCFCCVGKGENQIAKFIPTGYVVYRIPYSNPVLLILHFFTTIMRVQPDVIFSSVFNINTKLLLLSIFFPSKKFVIRSDNNVEVFSSKQKMLIKFLYKKARTIVAQTQEMKDGLVALGKINEQKIIVLPNPVDEKEINRKLQNAISPYSNHSSIIFVATGRFARAKGFDILVPAFAKVQKDVTNAELYIVGKNDGTATEYFVTIKSMIESLSLSSKIHCVGFQENPYPYIKYADCFVLSSRYEGLPNVLLEAMYLKRPVAAAKCIPIISRLVKDGENGFTAETEDVDSLAEAMKKAVLLKNIQNNYKSATTSDFEKIML